MSKNPTAFISKVGLSENPNAQTVEHPDGFPQPDGKKLLNVTSDGAPYFVITVEDDSNALSVRKAVLTSRMSRDSKNNLVWRSWKPARMLAEMKTKRLLVPGEFVTRNIKPSNIKVLDNAGNEIERTITTSTVFVGAGSTVEQAFKARGFELEVSAGSPESGPASILFDAGGFGMGVE